MTVDNRHDQQNRNNDANDAVDAPVNDGPCLSVTVQYFALARDLAATTSESYSLPIGSTIADLKPAILLRHPRLEPIASSLLYAINTDYASDQAPLTSGTTVTCFPPVSGG